jgi:hypothetical protein
MTDAQVKLGRAAEHIAAVRELVNAWLAGPDFAIERITGADGRTDARVRLTTSPPPRIAVVVGDAVHNLRAALDNAVYASARDAAGGALDEQTERALEFPVVGDGTKDDFDKLALDRRKLAGVPEPVHQVVEEDQPYSWNSDEHPDGYRFHPVWLVHSLNVIDKHRRLTLTAAAVRHPGFGVPEGVEPEPQWFHVEGAVTDGQRIASYLGDDLGVQFLYDLGVTLTDGPASDAGWMLGEMLDSLFNHVQWMVTRIEFASAATGRTEASSE